MLSVVYPGRCAACNELGREPFCEVCASALESAPSTSVQGFDEVVSCFEYGGPAAQALHRLKYQRQEWVARALGPMLRAAVLARRLDYDVATPVPLSRARLVRRGLNHAHQLARSAGFSPLRPLLQRIRDEGPQVGAGVTERRQRVRGAFCASRRASGRSILVVDDVVTTGATAEACARALRDAGARRLILAVLLRAC